MTKRDSAKSEHSHDEVTHLLLAWNDGDADALEKLAPIVERELRRLASHYLRGERPGHTLQTTALVNEAYVKLVDWKNVKWQNRAHFLGVSAQLMRRVLVDYARKRNFQKRGGAAVRIALEDVETVAEARDADLVALDEALKSLAAFDERKSRLVELRFFGGLSVEETAEVLGIAPRTVQREWSLAQAWLFRELRDRTHAAP
jgi:RNA polymerase sigma-70 factor, ECF subfamily